MKRKYIWYFIVLLCFTLYLGVWIAANRKHRQQIIAAISGKPPQTVLKVMGKPYRRYADPKEFNELQKVMAEEDLQLYPQMVPVKGEVWLYKTTSTKCFTIIFGRDRRVEKVITTDWPTLPEK